MSGLVLSACFIPILKVRKTESWWSEISWPAKYLSAPISATWSRRRIRAAFHWFIKHLVLNCCPGLSPKWVSSHLWTSIDEMGPDWIRLFVVGDHSSKSSTGANGFGMNQLLCLYTEVSERKRIHFCLSPSPSHRGVSRAFPPSCLQWSSAAQGGHHTFPYNTAEELEAWLFTQAPHSPSRGRAWARGGEHSPSITCLTMDTTL